MIDIKNIKLVAWDLDDTFWQGTISEEKVVPIEDNIKLVHDLTDCGIINTICSKNDYDVVEKKLKELGVWDEFVFASINWDNKAVRLQAIIDNMALRPANVLFLDDNHFNLQEALHLMPALQVANPEEAIPELIKQLNTFGKRDSKHKRLAQYKVLEAKAHASLNYASSEDFLYATHIKVEVIECDNSIDDALLTRLHELVMRTNQLNFTKNRCTIEDLKDRIQSEVYRCGYVKVHDKFGDYGIVGLYVLDIKENALEHFLFSCRTMGQKIEQWVYAQLGFPKLIVVGEVRTILNKEEIPGWINQPIDDNEKEKEFAPQKEIGKVLVKGPCDLSRVLQYIQFSENIDSEMTYVRQSNGQSIYAHNHSTQILNYYLSENEKDEICADCKFIDIESLSSKMCTEAYDIILLSTLLEADCGIYKNKVTGIEIPFAWPNCDMTDNKNWDVFLNGGCSGYRFTQQELENFSNKYEYIGATTSERYRSFLEMLLTKLPATTTLCLMLGATKCIENNDKAVVHAQINDVVKQMAKENKRVRYIDVNNGINSKADYDGGNIDHYQTKIYYYLAQEVVRLAEELSAAKIKTMANRYARIDTLLRKLSHLFNTDSKYYRSLRKFYWKLTGRKK